MDDEAPRWTADRRTSIVKTSVRPPPPPRRSLSLQSVVGDGSVPHPVLRFRLVFRRRDASEALLSGVISHPSARWRLRLLLQPKS